MADGWWAIVYACILLGIIATLLRIDARLAEMQKSQDKERLIKERLIIVCDADGKVLMRARYTKEPKEKDVSND